MVRSEADKKIGVYGGTFNPVHIGHINAAKEAVNKLGLDELWFIPVNIPPHKESCDLVSSKDRVSMLKLALNEYSRFKISYIEINRRGPSYSIDTLKELKKNYKANLYFIMGTDSFVSFESWYKWQEILKITNLVVVKRPGYEIEKKKLLNDGYIEGKKDEFIHEINKKIIFIEIKGIDLSSTKIRQCAKNKEKLIDFTGNEVAEYIERKGLYR